MKLRISASILFLTVLLVRAQPPVKDTRSTAISDARMRSILGGMDFDFTEDSTGDSIVFVIHLDGHVVSLVAHAKGMNLSACFPGDVDLMKGNQWNREHFSTRAYVDQNGCTSLGADVSFGGGATDQMIRDFVRGFSTSAVVFSRFLATSPARPDATSDTQAAGIPSPDRLASPIGTMAWSQVGANTRRTPPWSGATGSVPGVLKIDRNVSLKYDPKQWKLTVRHSDGQFAFLHSSGAHAVVISERTAVPLDSVQDVVLANAQSVDPHATLVFRYRNWNKGAPFWFLKIEATVGTIPMVYWGYFYVGEGGTVQVVTYAEKNRLPEYEQGFTDFLNGLTISK